jgi:2-polyprenyl-3-methyl-5-hydroxy-6-metoxy-1,4-benzoquinol methylase
MKNIHYRTDEIGKFYSKHRICWDDFYPSERWIFERVAGSELDLGRVLDAGCAVGGLGEALAEKFSMSEYVGVDINPQAIEKARRKRYQNATFNRRFECGDITEMDRLEPGGFDTVFSLGCVDWNLCTEEIISACWKYVREGGHFVLTLRLSPKPSILNMSESYQYIYFEDIPSKSNKALERAPYVVLNVNDALSILCGLTPRPEKLTTYGYWGQPSKSARTQYSSVVFAALSLKKGKVESEETMLECHWPVGLLL